MDYNNEYQRWAECKDLDPLLKAELASMNEKEKELAYIRNYVTKGVQNWGNGYKVKIMDSEKLFLNELARVEFCEVDEEEEQTVKSYVTSLIV